MLAFGLEARELTVNACPADGDTHCTGLDLQPSPNPGGPFVAVASAEDDSGDEIRYTFEASNGVDEPLVVGPQAESRQELDLAPGSWTVSVTVDDDPDCPDAAFDSSCSSELTVEPPGAGPMVPGDVTERRAGGSSSEGMPRRDPAPSACRLRASASWLMASEGSERTASRRESSIIAASA